MHPKANCYYDFTELSYESQQNLFVVLVLKIFGETLPLCLLCTIINTSHDDVILPNTQHIGEMKPLNIIDDSLNPPAVNEVTHEINSDHIDAQWIQPNSHSFPSCKIYSNSQPMPKSSIIMPGNV